MGCNLGKMLGFKSIKAQVACQNATGLHKAWQILTIFLYASADELLVPSVIHAMLCDKVPDLPSYYKWLDDVKTRLIYPWRMLFSPMYTHNFYLDLV